MIPTVETFPKSDANFLKNKVGVNARGQTNGTLILGGSNLMLNGSDNLEGFHLISMVWGFE